MKDTPKVSQDKKAPMDTLSEKSKNNSSSKDDKNSMKEEGGNTGTKSPRTPEKNEDKSKQTSRR